MFDTIADSLAKHKPVELRDFGRFSYKTLKLNIMPEILKLVRLFMSREEKSFL